MEVTLLNEEQIFGEDRLKVFDIYDTNAAITDFAILLGGFLNDNYYYNDVSLKDRTGCYWIYLNTNVGCSIGNCGSASNDLVYSRVSGVRPILPYSEISNISSNVVRWCDGILEVEYGEYPQKIVSKELQEELENAYQNKLFSIRKTGKTYTTDSRKYGEYDKEFSAQKNEEFVYKEKRYVRVKVNSCYDGNEFTLSNGEKYKDGDYVWVEVSPIKWLVEEKSDIALSEKILFAGIQFDDKEDFAFNFKETFMYNYLNTIFIKDIEVQPKEIEISVVEEKSERELLLEKLEKDKQKILNLRNNLDNQNCSDYMEITLLSEEQIFGKNKSKIFDEYGTKAAMTDFAILLGGFINDFYYYNSGNSLEDRTGFYWTSSDVMTNDVRVVGEAGNSDYCNVYRRYVGARPALPYSKISKIFSRVVRWRDGILEVEYGEYPQKAASKELQEELESAYKDNKTSIRKTGKTYTTDSRKYSEYDEEFSAQDYEEFEYKKKRYVRVKFNSFFDRARFTLSNGEKYKNGDYVWVEVSPIKWLVDIEKDVALSERILFAGIQFNFENYYKVNFKETFMYKFLIDHKVNFEETFMYKYLNTIFIKDIQVSKEIEISVIEEKSERELALEKLEKDKQKILNLRRNLGK